MKISKRAVGLALSVWMISCAAPQEQNNEAPVQIDENELSNDPGFPPVELNNGVKWVANAETTEGIKK